MSGANAVEIDWQVEQYPTAFFSLYTYFIKSDDESALVDPILDPQLYDNLLKETSTKLKYIFLTHKPFEFASNYTELANKTGATVVFEEKEDNEFTFGKVKIKLVSTPGFTKDSICYALINSKGKDRVLFTGPTLLNGDIGHPMMEEGDSDEEKSKRVETLFDSLSKLKTFDNKCIVFPGYGPDSVCGGKPQSEGKTVLSEQMNNNAYLKMEKEEFCNSVLPTCQIPKKFYSVIKQNNDKGLNYCDIIEKIPKMASEKVKKTIDDDSEKNIMLIDTRDHLISTKLYLKDGVIMPLKISYQKFLPGVIDYKYKLILICSESELNESVLSTMRVGYTEIIGTFSEESDKWKEAGLETESIVYENNEKEDMEKLVEANEYVIDIREIPEYKDTGVIKEAALIPLTGFSVKYVEVPKDKDVHVLCRSGVRACIGATFLKRMGYKKNILVLQGGILKLIETKYPLTKYEE